MDTESVSKLLELSFKEHWKKEALSNYQGETYTYGQLAARIKVLQMYFETLGIVKGDKIAICGRNQAGWGICFLASLTYGAVPVPILHEFKPENIHYLVNHSEAKVMFVDETIWEGLSETEMPGLDAIFKISSQEVFYFRAGDAAELCSKVIGEFESSFKDKLTVEDIRFHKDHPEELAMINYTSGTSGYSKGVMLPYRSLRNNIRFAKETAEPQLNSDSEVVAMLPSAHMYGLMFEFLFQMTIGSHVHFLTRVPSPKIILKAFSEIHPDIIIAVPLIIEKVYKSMIKPVVDRNKTYMRIPIIDGMVQKKIRNGMIDAFGGRFEEIILGGAAFNPEAEEFLKRIHFPFTVGYGMTECGPIITYAKWWRAKKGSCGIVVPRMEIRIDSPNPHKIPGEIQVKGDNVFLGYYKNREATRKAFTNDNWFKTGDMGIVDNEGYLFLRGRSKCMILGPSGQNIYPEELEAVINNVSYVVESLVVEDNGGLTAIIYPDYHQGELDKIERKDLEKRISDALPEINRMLPSYAQVRKIEFIPEDFERTPKRSIKRYLYQRN